MQFLKCFGGLLSNIRTGNRMIQDILIKAMISSFCESMYLSYFRFQSNAWQDEGVIFFLSQVSQWRRCDFFYLSFLKKSGSCLKVSLSHLKLSEFRWIWQRQWRDWLHVTCCSRQLLSSFWRWEKLFVVLTTSSNFGLYEQFFGNF